MPLTYYPRDISVPADHPINDFEDKLVSRFKTSGLSSPWVVTGPMLNRSRSCYYFVLSCKSPSYRFSMDIDEADFLFSEDINEKIVSGILPLVAKTLRKLQPGCAPEAARARREQADGFFRVEDGMENVNYTSRSGNNIREEHHERSEESGSDFH